LRRRAARHALVPLAALLALLAVTASGCAPHYARYQPLETWDKEAGYKLPEASADNGDSLFVILAFSGGGTRAAALSYGVMEVLRETTLEDDGEARSLLDEVDVISSVSGGSFTAAYYGLFRDELFSEYEDAFLHRNIQGALVRRFLNPIRWPRLWTPGYDRIHLAADLYDRTVFRGRTFGELVLQNRRPLLLLNASDMATGGRFEFTQYQFDPLCEDLASVPVADAVAASSAFPFLLSPMTVPSRSGTCGFGTPMWLDNALGHREDNAPRFYRALDFLTYLDVETQKEFGRYHDPVDKRFVHLMDGGIADNIGLRGPLQALVSGDVAWSVQRKINNREVDRIVLITVNARPGSQRPWNDRANAPLLPGVFTVVMGTPLRNYSFDTVQLAEEYAKSEEETQRTLQDCKDVLAELCPGEPFPGGDLHPITAYSIEVNFDAVEDPDERQYLKTLGTTFSLPDEAIDRLRRAAREVLLHSKEYKQLLEDLHATPPRGDA